MARPFRVAAVVVTLLLGFLACQRLAGLDRRFLTISSLSGAEGLAAYLLGDYAWAAEAYRRDLTKRLADAQHGAPLGTRALLAGDLDAAHRDASEALRTGRNERDGRLTLGEVALARGRHQEAIAELDTLLATDVDQFDALLVKAVAQARLGLDGDAITSLNRALRHDRVETRPTAFLSALALTGELGSRPRRPTSLLATLHRYLRIYDAAQASVAVRYAEQAIAAGDHPADAHLTIGIVHLKHNRRARALASFRAAVAAEPRHPIALVRAANLHGLRGDLPEKDRLMTAAFEVAPEDHWVAEALQAATQYLQRQPRDFRAAVWMATAFFNENQFVEVRDVLEPIVHHHKERNTYLLYGTALSRTGRVPEGIRWLEQSLELDADFWFTYYLIGVAWTYAGDYRAAIPKFEEALRRAGGWDMTETEYALKVAREMAPHQSARPAPAAR